MELREKEGLVRPACEHANATPLPYHAAAAVVGSMRWLFGGWMACGGAVGVCCGRAGDREVDGLGRWNSRCHRVLTI